MENAVVSEKWSYVTVFNGLLRGTVKNQDLFIELNELSGQNEHLIAEYEKVMLRSDRFFFFQLCIVGRKPLIK